MGRGAMDGVSPASQIVFLEKKVAELEAQLVEKEITIDQLTVTANTWNRKYDDECILTAHLQAQLDAVQKAVRYADDNLLRDHIKAALKDKT